MKETIKNYKEKNIIFVGIDKLTKTGIVKFNEDIVAVGNLNKFSNLNFDIYDIPNFESPFELARGLETKCLNRNYQVDCEINENWCYIENQKEIKKKKKNKYRS